MLPVANGVGRDAEALGRLALEEAKVEAAGTEVVADGAYLLGVGVVS